jgi:hypothetical protein
VKLGELKKVFDAAAEIYRAAGNEAPLAATLMQFRLVLAEAMEMGPWRDPSLLHSWQNWRCIS